jgi:hypothetical protein
MRSIKYVRTSGLPISIRYLASLSSKFIRISSRAGVGGIKEYLSSKPCFWANLSPSIFAASSFPPKFLSIDILTFCISYSLFMFAPLAIFLDTILIKW